MLDFQERLTTLYQEHGSSQDEAWNRFLELGLPTREIETYRYVRLRDLYKNHYSHGYRDIISSLPPGVIALPLSEAFKTYGSYLRPRLKKQFEEERDPFAALNGALYTEGLFVYIPPKMVCEPISLKHLMEQSALFSPRIHVFVGKEASVTVEISHEIAADGVWMNQMIDFALEERADVKLIMQGNDLDSTWHFDAIRATLKQGSRFKSFAITQGGATSRQDYVVRLLGEGCEASLYGVWDLDDTRHHHVNILMDHQEPHCTSLQKFKGVLRGTSRSSFEGKIYVHQRAQKTQAYQMNPNLILGKHASANSKPNLEIYADDVKASHGATIGQLDEEQLFYLTTRGIPKKDAQEMLVKGFVQEILDQMR